MKPFENRTTDGNERAVRRGKSVPKDAVGLSWVKSPKMTTENNVILVDTSQVVEENTLKDAGDRKIYYANSVGVLEDRFGNQLVEDEFPVVSDVFLQDEDFSTIPAEEYEDDEVLSFVHVSRYFHVDFAGLTLHNDLFPYVSSKIKVVDGRGQEYTRGDGTPRYKVKIATAYAAQTDEQNAYRLHVYVDTDENEDLYLSYNKIELDADGAFRNNEPFYKEILNPIPYFAYTPEESEVVDPVNRDKKVYSTRPMNLKEQVTGASPGAGQAGYKVYVPKKAVGDPRVFQLFRWRVSCNFKQKFKVDPSSPAGIRCGIITTGGTLSRTPYAFLNLSRSQYNVTGMKFYNPLQDDDAENPVSEDVKETAAYWEVDFDTVTNDELKQFDVLLWSPPHASEVDLSKYAGKVNYFTGSVGGTIFMDTNARAKVKGLGLNVSAPVSVSYGYPTVTTTDVRAYGYTKIFQADREHELFKGALSYGGWNFNDDLRTSDATWDNVSWHSRVYDEYDSLTIYRSIYDKYEGGPVVHFIKSVPAGWDTLQTIQTPYSTPWQGVYKPCLITRTVNKAPAMTTNNAGTNTAGNYNPNKAKPGNKAGNFTLSTLGIAESVNVLADNNTKNIISYNNGPTLDNQDDYRLYINSSWTEGAYKFLFNICLVALKNKPLDNSDERTYSTTFSSSSEWKSSWVIDGDVLSESERAVNDLALLPTDSATPTPAWQRKLSNKTLEQLINESLPDDLKQKVQGATREYQIEVTNSKVEVPLDVGGSNLPYAWTSEYSPAFVVPVELGPHVIRAEDVKGAYEAGQYVQKSYPAKPYNAKVVLDYVDSEELHTIQPVNWVVTGTATETITTGIFIPPSSTTKESEVELSWAEHGSQLVIPSGYAFEEGMPSPVGLTTWKTQNYYNTSWGTGSLNWPNYGIYHQLTLGSRGEVVTWVQDAMNVFQFFGFFHYGELKLDGYYGNRTEACIIAFQEQMGCSRVTGITDAETFSLIGAQVIRLGNLIYKNRKNSGWSRFYFWPRTRMLRQAISDNSTSTSYSRRSWITDGPSVIWDMFMVAFEDVYNIHGVSITPEVDGDTKTMMFRSIDVRTQPFNLVNYDSRKGNPIWMPHRPRDGQEFYVPFSPRRGDTIIVGVGQDGPSGWGSSRILGVRDLRAHARVRTTTTKPGVNTIRKQTIDRTVTYSGTSYVAKTKEIKIRIPFPAASPHGKIHSVRWESVAVDNPDVVAQLVLNTSDSGDCIILSNYIDETRTQQASATGPKFPDHFLGPKSYYWMNPDSRQVSKLRETGWISKADGVKVLSDSQGKPIGFPASVPSLAAAADEQQRHFSRLRVESVGNDASVQVGFYDIRDKEFITNVHGEPEMSFIEYLQRGRENVYLAAVSTYEVETSKPLPDDDDAPLLPYKWAMPVYGLYKRRGSKIGIGTLPKNLGQSDVWPIPVSTGKFERSVYVRPMSHAPVEGFLGRYQGRTVTAHYSVPEAESAEWSQLFGPPYADIKGETPEILDDDVLRVAQAPIHARIVPTPNPSVADPMRPFFSVYKRDTVEDEWVKLNPSEIKDYNISTGEIFLEEKMVSSDPLLWKVDYTSLRSYYHFKGDMSTTGVVDLNPYSNFSSAYLDDATYFYILPQHVRDDKGKVIEGSVRTSTLRLTRNPSIFDPFDAGYNPLAIQLAVIYLNTALDISQLAMLDVRKRGGGASSNANLEEIKRVVQDAASYWDMDHNSGLSYQKSGFVVIRLPEELKDYFSEKEIKAVIEKNITAGVKFKIEDMSGKDWS